MKENIINPNGLKGKDVLSRVRELMGESIQKDTKNYVIELTKKGPDGKVYAIVRENHSYFIKVTDKTKNIVGEDFKYLGGLQNITEGVYTSYAKAIKHLNLKFINLSEAYGKNNTIDTFSNDNLVEENNAIGAAGWGFAETTVFEDEESMKEEVEVEDAAVEDALEEALDISDEENITPKNSRMSIANAIQDCEDKSLPESIKKKV
jgi:hypothetical protein